MTTFRDDRDSHPPMDYAGYKSTALRHPKQPLIPLAAAAHRGHRPVLGEDRVGRARQRPHRQHEGEPIGQRIIVHGHVKEDDGRPVPNTLVEIWQANAGGRYRHAVDNWPSPLDPNFTGGGRTMTDDKGASASSRSSPAPTRGATTRTPGGPRTSTSACSGARSRSGS